MFSGKELKKLIVPLIIEQILAVSIGFMDTIMVSTVSEAAVSGVSLVDSISNLIIQIFAALTTGGAVVCSQYLGHGEKDKAKKSAGQLIFIMAALSCSVMVVMIAGNQKILRFIFGSIEDDVMKNASIYFLLSAVSYPFLGIYNSGAALFRSIGNSKVSMKTSAIMNVMNIGGNALMIFGFHLGVLGAAIATLVSRIFSAVVMMILLYRTDSVIKINRIRDLASEGNIIKKILQIGIPSGLENGMFHIGKLSVSSLISTFGTSAIAANSIASNVASFANIPGNAIGMAMITVVGRCIGAGDKKQAKSYTAKLMKIAYAGIIITNVLMYMGTGIIVGFFNLSPEAVELSVQLLHSFVFAAILIWPLSFTLPNALRAAGDAKYTMGTSIFSMWAFRVVSSYFLAGTLNLGVIGVWIGMYIDWAFRSLLFVIRYFRGKWLDKKVI